MDVLLIVLIVYVAIALVGFGFIAFAILLSSGEWYAYPLALMAMALWPLSVIYLIAESLYANYQCNKRDSFAKVGKKQKKTRRVK